MPFLNKEQRDLVKKTLDEVMTDKELTAQFNAAKKRKDGVVSDYSDAMLGQYMGIIKEIQQERASYTPPEGVVQSPDLETLKKKYLGGPKKG